MMKKLLVMFTLLAIGTVCYADWNTYETRQDAYNRRSYQNYNTYQNNNYQAPLGGYNNSMNDNGGRQYGMNGNSGMGSLNRSRSNNYSRSRSNGWNSY